MRYGICDELRLYNENIINLDRFLGLSRNGSGHSLRDNSYLCVLLFLLTIPTETSFNTPRVQPNINHFSGEHNSPKITVIPQLIENFKFHTTPIKNASAISRRHTYYASVQAAITNRTVERYTERVEIATDSRLVQR